jgi:predicted RNase H-like nuclease (RuvC/YqgF family)
LSRLNEQLSSSRADAERAKLEASALKARGQILESEMKKFKSHLRSLLSKSETDDRLVEALRTELRSTKGNLEAMTKKAQTAHLHSLPVTSSGSNTLHESDEIAQRTINALKMQISQLRSEIDAVGSTPRPILQQQHFMHQDQQQQQQQIPLSRPLHVYSTSDRDTR